MRCDCRYRGGRGDGADQFTAADELSAAKHAPDSQQHRRHRMSEGGASNFRAVERPDGSHRRCRYDGNNRHGGTTGTAGTTGAAGTAAAAAAASPAAAQNFILTNATIGSAEASAAGSTAAAPPAAAPPAASANAPTQTYRLVANAASLSPHVGKKLELTGTLEEPNSSPSTASSASAAADSKMPALRVQSGKIVAASCSE